MDPVDVNVDTTNMSNMYYQGANYYPNDIGAEGFAVSAPAGSYVQAPQNQGGNQGPGGLRGIPPSAVPPSSTPPNADLKVPPLPPQPSINPSTLMFPQSVRPTQQFYRSTAPSSQNQRMPNHNNRPQQAMFHQPQLYSVQQQPVFIPGIPYGTSTRQPNFVQTLPVYPPQYQYQFNTTQTPPPTISYFYNPQMVGRPGGTIPTPQPATPNPTQQTLPLQMMQTNSQHQTFQSSKPTTNKRRQHALKIVDPATGIDKLEEILGENSHPPSGESSARQTPQPASATQKEVKEVQATFAKQVMQAIGAGDDNQQRLQDDEEPQQHHHHIAPHHLQQQQHNNSPHSQMPPPPSQLQQQHAANGANNSMQQHQVPPPPGHPGHLDAVNADAHNFQLPPPHLQQHPHHPHHQQQPHQQQQQHHHPGVGMEQHVPPQTPPPQAQLGGQYPAAPPPQSAAVQQIHPQVVPVASSNAVNVSSSSPPFVPSSSSSSVSASNVPSAESNIEHIVRTSNFNALAKEFVSTNTINVAKETTPVVSANIDAEEVTLPPKLHKDRESPVKVRRAFKAVPMVAPVPEHHPQQQQPQSSSTERTASGLSTSTTATGGGDEKTSTGVGEGKKHNKDTSSSSNTTNSAQVVSKEGNAEEISEPKKGQKKDKAETKDVESQSQQSSTAVPDALSNAKTKQSSRNASKQGSQHQNQNNNQKSTATPVPQSQPPKSSNKSHKKLEMNLKGANKEGTDMDAFNDNAATVKDAKEQTAPGHNNTNSTQPDTNDINANSHPHLTNNLPPAGIANKDVINSVNNDNNTNNKFESNDTINNSNNSSQPNTNATISTPAAAVPTATTVAALAAAPPPLPATVTKPKTNKVDVTSIVRDVPKSTKPLILPTSNNNNNNSTDETDRAVLAPSSLDIMNANNNNNSKLASKLNSDQTTTVNNANLDNNNRIELTYQEGQWSPANPTGAKKYPRDFLLALRNSPCSKVKPETILDIVAADDRGRMNDGGRASMGGRSDYQNSSYNYGGKSGSRGGTGQKRNSSQSKQSMGGGTAKNMKAPQAKVSISLREDVKLHEAENAWRPARFVKGEFATDEDRKTEELYKNVRGILNKLTPQKFDTLLVQIKALQIDNQARLQGVIDLVFNKAVDEPNFSVAYAKMCKELALMHVPTPNSTPEKEEFVNFRKILITRCQHEFEKQSKDESERNTRLKEIEECTDPDKKKDLQFDLEEYDRKLRMKSVGNVRFIGELFKQDMLTVNIMVRCLHNLLENKDEESLECLCKLLTTIGKELESKNVDLTPIFAQMKSIAEKKDAKVSSRIRFMLQDVIDLRASKWVPRRQDFNPKTIDQIQKEAEREQMNIQMMNSMPATPRKDDRVGGGGGSGSMMGSMDRKGGRGGGRNVSEDGWVTSSQRSRATPFTVHSDKLKVKNPLDIDQLGSMSAYQSWGKGSQGTKSTMPQSITNTGNMYAPLDNNILGESDRRLGGYSRGKDTYHSKGPSLERNYNKYDGRGSRSGSQHRSSNDSMSSGPPSSQRSTPASMAAPPPSMMMSSTTSSVKINLPPPSNNVVNATSGSSAAAGATPPTLPGQISSNNSNNNSSTSADSTSSLSAAATAPVPQLTEEQIEKRLCNSLDEYVSGVTKVQEYFQDISSLSPLSHSTVISVSYLRVFEKSQHDRMKTGELFAKLVKDNQISLNNYCAGLEEVLAQADDLKIDIPKFWDYLAEILVDIVSEEALPLSKLFELSKQLINQSDISKLLACLFKLIVARKGPAHLQQLWQRSGIRLTDFLDSSRVDSFIKDNHLEFLLEGSAPASKKELSFEEIQEHLSALLRKKASHDEIFQWITNNVGERVKENKFIRALVTAIFEDSISPNNKLMDDVLLQHSNLLLKYIDNNSTYELEGLYALQALVNKLEHPKGLLLAICTTLLDSLMFSHESFVAWEQSTDPAEQEGKGVALKQLTAFITQLKENEEDDETSGEDA